jgi:hypothetical protein
VGFVFVQRRAKSCAIIPVRQPGHVKSVASGTMDKIRQSTDALFQDQHFPTAIDIVAVGKSFIVMFSNCKFSVWHMSTKVRIKHGVNRDTVVPNVDRSSKLFIVFFSLALISVGTIAARFVVIIIIIIITL